MSHPSIVQIRFPSASGGSSSGTAVLVTVRSALSNAEPYSVRKADCSAQHPKQGCVGVRIYVMSFQPLTTRRGILLLRCTQSSALKGDLGRILSIG